MYHFQTSGFWGSTIGLAGWGIWLIFVAIFGMGAENRSGKRKFHLRARVGFCVFEESGRENRKGKVAGYGILIFTRLHDLTGAGWYKWIVCRWSVSAFKWCIDQGRVALMTSYYESFRVNFGKRYQAHVVLHFLVLSAFLTFPTLSIERLLEQVWSALVSPASMATPADGNVTLRRSPKTRYSAS